MVSIKSAKKTEVSILPEDIRRAVIEACKKELKPSLLHVIVCAVFAAIFIPLGVSVLANREIPEERFARIWYGIIFLLVPFLIAYSTVLRPWRHLHKAKKGDYEHYVGTLTHAEKVDMDDGAEYHLTLDGEVKCYCTKKQYKEAVIGARYIAAFFDHDGEEPPLMIRLTQKEII